MLPGPFCTVASLHHSSTSLTVLLCPPPFIYTASTWFLSSPDIVFLQPQIPQQHRLLGIRASLRLSL